MTNRSSAIPPERNPVNPDVQKQVNKSVEKIAEVDEDQVKGSPFRKFIEKEPEPTGLEKPTPFELFSPAPTTEAVTTITSSSTAKTSAPPTSLPPTSTAPSTLYPTTTGSSSFSTPELATPPPSTSLPESPEFWASTDEPPDLSSTSSSPYFQETATPYPRETTQKQPTSTPPTSSSDREGDTEEEEQEAPVDKNTTQVEAQGKKKTPTTTPMQKKGEEPFFTSFSQSETLQEKKNGKIVADQKSQLSAEVAITKVKKNTPSEEEKKVPTPPVRPLTQEEIAAKQTKETSQEGAPPPAIQATSGRHTTEEIAAKQTKEASQEGAPPPVIQPTSGRHTAEEIAAKQTKEASQESAPPPAIQATSRRHTAEEIAAKQTKEASQEGAPPPAIQATSGRHTAEEIAARQKEEKTVLPFLPEAKEKGEGSSDKDSDSKKGKGSPTKEVTSITPPTLMVLPSEVVPIAQTASSQAAPFLSPETLSLYYQMVGNITAMVAPNGDSHTEFVLNAPGFANSKFYGATISIDRFSTAPYQLNIRLTGSQEAVTAFNQNLPSLMNAFRQGNFSFTVNRLDAVYEKPIFRRKEKTKGEKEK